MTDSKDSLKAQALTQRIAQIVAQYEDQMADFRAESTIVINQAQEQINALQQEVDILKSEANVVDVGQNNIIQKEANVVQGEVVNKTNRKRS